MSTHTETRPAAQLARVHQLVAAFNAHNTAAFAQFLAPYATRLRGDGRSIEDRTMLVAQLQNFFIAFPDATLTTVAVQAFPPDAVLVEWTLEATHLAEWWVHNSNPVPPTGLPIRALGADLLHFDLNNEIDWDEARVDTSALFGLAQAQPDSEAVHDLAKRYTIAWNSSNPANVAAFFSPYGSLRVNGGAPAVGPGAIAQVAESFMTAFPDLELLCDEVRTYGDRAVYLWTFLGTNTGPGGTGKRVRFSGYEVWRIGGDGLIAESRGYFDSGGYQRQLQHGIAT